MTTFFLWNGAHLKVALPGSSAGIGGGGENDGGDFEGLRVEKRTRVDCLGFEEVRKFEAEAWNHSSS